MATEKGRSMPKGGGTTGAHSSTPSMLTRASSRNAPPTAATKQDIMKQGSYTVKDKATGEKYLMGQALCVIGEPFTPEHLAMVLFHITQIKGIPRAAIESIRAVAYLMEEGTQSTVAEMIAERATKELTTNLTNHVITAISPHIASIHASAEGLRTQLQEIGEIQRNRIPPTGNETRDRLAELSELVSLLKPTLEGLHSPTNQPRTYSDAAKQSTPAHSDSPITAVMARIALKERQVLLEPNPGAKLYETSTDSSEIVNKLKIALDKSSTEDSPQITIRSVNKLRNGGLVVEFTSAEAANWVKLPQSRNAITSNLGLPAVIRDRTYPLVVTFLPVTCPISSANFLRRVEEENNMTRGVMESARWIKQPERRASEQRVAHAIFQLSDPMAANLLIRDGLCINHERLHPRKDKREPVRCMRCQLWGHLTRDCRAPHDVCGTCGNKHKTSECNAYRTTFCISCQQNDHPSWHRNCPEFTARCSGINAKTPENSMPYFPTDEAWTQVILPPKAPPHHRTQPAPLVHPRRPEDSALRQTKLDHRQAKPREQREAALLKPTQKQSRPRAHSTTMVTNPNRIPTSACLDQYFSRQAPRNNVQMSTPDNGSTTGPTSAPTTTAPLAITPTGRTEM